MLQYSSYIFSLRLKFVATAINIKILKSYKPLNWQTPVVNFIKFYWQKSYGDFILSEAYVVKILKF